MTTKSQIRSALVVQYFDEAPLGNLGEWLHLAGVETVPVGKGEMGAALDGKDFDVVILLGSADSVLDDSLAWLAEDQAALRRCASRQQPVLGVCFGAQMIASALGATVERRRASEIGWQELPTAGDEDIWKGPWFQWHHDWISVKETSWLLAGSAEETQAFRKDSLIGVQFHPEVTADIIETWMQSGGGDFEDFQSLKAKILSDNQTEVDAGRIRAFKLYRHLFSMLGFDLPEEPPANMDRDI